MESNYEVFDLEKHRNAYVILDKKYEHAKSHHFVNITPHEIAKVALSFPICFVKNQVDSTFQLVAIMGLEAGNNAYFDGEGFVSTYVPLNIQKYPFHLAKTDDGNVFLALDSASINYSEQGEALVTHQGEPSEYTKRKQAQLTELYEQDSKTAEFVSALIELGLLSELPFKYNLGDDKPKQINGLYSVDRELLRVLDDDSLLSLYKLGYLEAIYAHLMSLGQFQRLIDLSAKA